MHKTLEKWVQIPNVRFSLYIPFFLQKKNTFEKIADFFVRSAYFSGFLRIVRFGNSLKQMSMSYDVI